MLSNNSSDDFFEDQSSNSAISLRDHSKRNSLVVMTFAASLLFSSTAVCSPDTISKRYTETGTSFIGNWEGTNDSFADREDNKAIAKVRKLRQYPDNWDGNGAVAPDRKAVSEAEDFMRILLSRELKLPYISLANDGEINFFWDDGDISLDLGFYGEGFYSYYGKDKNGKEYMADEIPCSKELPADILKLLT